MSQNHLGEKQVYTQAQMKEAHTYTQVQEIFQ